MIYLVFVFKEPLKKKLFIFTSTKLVWLDQMGKANLNSFVKKS